MSRQTRNVVRNLSVGFRSSLVWFWVIATVACLAVGAAFQYLTSDGTVADSYWEYIGTSAKVYFAVVGILMVPQYLPVFVAHGTTRRDFARGSLAFAVLAAAISALLIHLGYGMEGMIYRANGWQRAISQEHLFTAVNQPVPMFAEYSLLLVAYFVSGCLIGAGYYRFGWLKGLLFMPVGLVPILGLEWVVQDLPGLLQGPLGTGPVQLLVAGLLGVGVVVFGAGLFHCVVRDVPIRRRTA